jgi:hypothetical protein
LDYSLPENQEDLRHTDPYFSDLDSYQENHSVGTPEYHVPEDTSDFPEASKFNLEYYILAGGAGGRPPSPPESPPHTPRDESEDNSEERDRSESEP